MLIEDFDAFFDVPESMIEKYYHEFMQHKTNNDRVSICASRDAAILILLSLREDPDKLNDPFYVNNFIKAHAMREALKKLGVLYDA
jgi:hypothetical protein